MGDAGLLAKEVKKSIHRFSIGRKLVNFLWTKAISSYHPQSITFEEFDNQNLLDHIPNSCPSAIHRRRTSWPHFERNHLRTLRNAKSQLMTNAIVNLKNHVKETSSYHQASYYTFKTRRQLQNRMNQVLIQWHETEVRERRARIHWDNNDKFGFSCQKKKYFISYPSTSPGHQRHPSVALHKLSWLLEWRENQSTEGKKLQPSRPNPKLNSSIQAHDASVECSLTN